MPTASVRARSPRIVQSRQNARVKELRAGFARASRTEHGHIAIEGEHLLLEAIAAGLTIPAVFVRTGDEHLLERLRLPADTEVIALPTDIFSSAVSTESPQGIAALVDPPAFTLDYILNARATALILIAAGLQDPGNLGTLIRTAEAFAATGSSPSPAPSARGTRKPSAPPPDQSFACPSLLPPKTKSFPRSHLGTLRYSPPSPPTPIY